MFNFMLTSRTRLDFEHNRVRFAYLFIVRKRKCRLMAEELVSRIGPISIKSSTDDVKTALLKHGMTIEVCDLLKGIL